MVMAGGIWMARESENLRSGSFDPCNPLMFGVDLLGEFTQKFMGFASSTSRLRRLSRQFATGGFPLFRHVRCPPFRRSPSPILLQALIAVFVYLGLYASRLEVGWPRGSGSTNWKTGKNHSLERKFQLDEYSSMIVISHSYLNWENSSVILVFFTRLNWGNRPLPIPIRIQSSPWKLSTNVLAAGGEEHGQALPGPRVRDWPEAMTLYPYMAVTVYWGYTGIPVEISKEHREQ